MKKTYLPLFLLLCTPFFSQQSMLPLQIKSPQSYAFEKYGNVPINLYTGTIDLKIPIYSLPTSGGKNIDVFLSYDSSGFLPHKKSDYGGIGWSLLAGGRITRTLNRIPDEYKGDPTSLNSNPFDTGADLHGFLTGVRLNPYSNTQVYNLNSGAGGINGLDWRLGSSKNGYEGEPDVFHFNAPGLSGKFMVGNDGNVMVESNDPNLKVDLTGFVSYEGRQFCTPPDQTIVMTDGQGTKYYFGGDFSKYEIGYSLSAPGMSKDSWFIGFPYINSFSLSKIEFVNGQSVTYGYVQDTLNDQFCNLTTSSYNVLENAKVLNFEAYFQDGAVIGEWKNCPGGTCASSLASSSSDKEFFVLTKRSLLESIQYGNQKVKINYKDIGYPIKHYEGASDRLEFNEYVLDNIQVFNNNLLIQNTTFEYDHLGGSNKRPFLKNIIEQQSNKVYSFEYYNTSTLPKYTTKGLDHWGYWNGNDYNISLAPFDTYNSVTGDYTLNNTFRDTNIEKYNIGLLSKVTYPTKGYTVFEYEPNYYGKRIERNSGSQFLPTLTDNAGVVGGARIRKQYDYSENGGIINEKNYKYTTSLNGTSSSGILMNWPRYLYYIEFKDATYLQKLMLKSSSNIQQNSLDSYNVGYQKVYEINTGKGYIEHNYTNYEDYPDILYPDTNNIRNYFSGTYQSYPENLYKNLRNLYGIDRSILRGRLKSEIIYNEGTTNPLKKTEYVYNDNIDFNPNTTKDNDNFVTVNHLSGYWVQGYKRYFNTSAIKKKITTDFLNNKPIANTTDYYYDSSNHLNLTKENNITSDDAQLSKIFLYAQDPNTANNLMVSKNITGVPLITNIKQNNKSISKSETIYPILLPTTQTGNLLLPISVKSYDIQNETTSIETTFDKYDNKGNIQQYTTKDGIPTVIVWGYNHHLPIAKIEGKDAPYFLSSLNTDIVSLSNDSDTDIDSSSEQSFREKLDIFQSRQFYFDVSITTYTYDPLIGVTSITPPSGIREVYIYDAANRLKEIRQDSPTGNVVKTFKYNYKN